MCHINNNPIYTAAQSFPHLAACSYKTTVQYKDLPEQINNYLKLLRECNCVAGDRVLLIASPSEYYIIALWALFYGAIIACPINPILPESKLKAIVSFLRPTLILYDDSTAAKVKSLGCRGLSMDDLHNNAQNYSQPAYSLPLLAEGQLTTAVATSGSTGTPRFAVHTLDNHLFAAVHANNNLPLNPCDVWLLSLPLFHVSGLSLLFRCILAGATLLISSGKNIGDTLQLHPEISHVSLVPTQLARLLRTDAGARRLKELKGVLLGGAPANRSLIKEARARQVPLVRSYGMTETAAQFCATKPGASLEELYSSGYPLVSESIRIDQDSSIKLRSPAIFAGYYQPNGTIDRLVTADGWFSTGDLGYFDAYGRLHVTGRKDTLFISGGENIYPEEIEGELKELPEIEDAVVVEMPDNEYGALPVAFILWKDGCARDQEWLLSRLSSFLPRYKIPRKIFDWPEQSPPGMKTVRSFFRSLIDVSKS